MGGAERGKSGGDAAATPGLSRIIRILRIRKIRKDYEQERNMSRLVRVGNSVRHAQAQGLARRIQSAAKLRSRHRAWQSAICSQDD